MKLYNLLRCALVLACCLSLISCRETEIISPDIVIPGLGGTQEAENELDQWLYEQFVEPYNIEVVYRWDAAQMYTSLDAKLVPIEYDMVKPMMSAIRDVWFTPFIQALGNDDFLKQYTPKKVVLVGSPEYVNGGIKLGQAEGGKKIMLLNANFFDPTNKEEVQRTLETIIHEFGHILHQHILFSPDFQTVSTGFYDATGWNQIRTSEEAYEQGFVSRYSMSAYQEDFVELFAKLTVRGYEWFETTVLPVAQASEVTDAEGALLRKIAILEDYLLTNYDLLLFDDEKTGQRGVESYMQEAISALMPPAPEVPEAEEVTE